MPPNVPVTAQKRTFNSSFFMKGYTIPKTIHYKLSVMCVVYHYLEGERTGL